MLLALVGIAYGLGDDQVIIFARFILKKVETLNSFLRQSLINVTFPG